MKKSVTLPEPITYTAETEEWRQRGWMKVSNGKVNGTMAGPTKSNIEWWEKEKLKSK